MEPLAEMTPSVRDHEYCYSCSPKPPTADASTQTAEEPASRLKTAFVESVTRSDDSIMDYTGCPNKAFYEELCTTVAEESCNLPYWTGPGASEKREMRNDRGRHRTLSSEEAFLLTLIKLRLDLTFMMLADLFCVSAATASRTFTTWITLAKNCISSIRFG